MTDRDQPTRRPDTPPELTEEQQAVVDHDHGPALVFAVAGAGKTTAMVRRIERLVRERVFAPRSILAASFSRAAVADVAKALRPWPHCTAVKVATLHSVGNSILTLARKCGHLAGMRLMEDGNGEAGALVLGRTLARARREDAPYRPELDALDREDFLGYVGACKAGLLYPDLDGAALPDGAARVAGQAPAPPGLPWYLDLYRLYEQTRLQDDMLTFDDLLMTGWECLVRFPDVLSRMRGRYRSIVCDEFQDVSLAQSEILDLLTQPAREGEPRDYMAIGDDDQTIYEWRGASTDFILDFERRYGATKYLIGDNFRSQASHLALANRVIERNARREPKRLSLTRGFGGGVHVHREGGAEEAGAHVAGLIGQALADSYAPGDIAVLVRLYAQTPFIEHALIERGIPYRVVGSTPFYERPEVVTLLDYLRLGLLERQLQGGTPLTDDQVADHGARWKRIVNRPTRFIPQAASDAAWRDVALHGATPSRAALVAAAMAPERAAAPLRRLAEDLRWLAARSGGAGASPQAGGEGAGASAHDVPTRGMSAHDVLTEGTSAHDVLTELDRRLGYADFLRASSGFPETGEARAAGARAFTAYAREKGGPADLLAHIDRVSFGRAGKGDGGDGAGPESVPIMTAFRAKGLQWPVVFVPDCNQGVFPLRSASPLRDVLPLRSVLPLHAEAGLEEERRLFYVAITRAQEHLHLHVTGGAPVSQFLREADWEGTLGAVHAVQAALERDPAEWRTRDALALARHTPELGLERFLQSWWDAPAERIGRAAQAVLRLIAAAAARGLDGPLGLTAERREFWETFGPLGRGPAGDEFPDLASFVPEPPPPAPADPRPDTAGGAGPDPPPRFGVGERVHHPGLGEGTVAAVSGPRGNPTVEVAWDTGRRTRLVARVAGLRPV